MKYYIIAGEASGDLHGANLIKALKQQDEDAQFRCWGGDLMEDAGGELVKHYRDLAFMGFVEVVKNLRTILGNIRFCKNDLLAFAPDVLILIDYPGFNLRIAEFARQQGIKVYYYVAPQVWAWHESRVPKMKQNIDELFVILPFEKDYFANKWDWKVHFLGHPLLDATADKQAQLAGLRANDLGLEDDTKPIIALLPGSRKQEIRTKLPLMLSVRSHFPNHQFVVAGAPAQEEVFYHQIIENQQYTANKATTTVSVINNKTYELLHLAEAALVTSGTATLETALFNVPQVVCYKANWLSYRIARWLVDLDFIGLVNLIEGREVVKELIQEELNTTNLVAELQAILPNGNKRPQVLTDYQNLKEKLGGEGASKKIAQAMWERLNV